MRVSVSASQATLACSKYASIFFIWSARICSAQEICLGDPVSSGIPEAFASAANRAAFSSCCLSSHAGQISNVLSAQDFQESASLVFRLTATFSKVVPQILHLQVATAFAMMFSSSCFVLFCSCLWLHYTPIRKPCQAFFSIFWKNFLKI